MCVASCVQIVRTASLAFVFASPLFAQPAFPLRFHCGDAGVTCAGDRPFSLDVKLAEGDDEVTVVLGGARDMNATVRAESRRLMLEGVQVPAGGSVTRTFTVNVRTPLIPGGDSVRRKPREIGSNTWDDKLSLEFNGAHPAFRELTIVPAQHPVTVYLAGNSTVVDQAAEPWAAWGQMIPRFFQPGVVVIANHAESGETLKSFVGEKRLAKVLSTIKAGDYLFIEFAHNDQKPGASHVEPFTTYKEYLRRFISDARAKEATPVLVTSMHRRTFDSTGHITNSLGDYPDAMRQTAAEEHVALIDLNAMSKQFYEALGPEQSVKAFVHYPAGTYPDQAAELKDDTHFNNYGAYELARLVVEGIRGADSRLAGMLLPGLPVFDPAHPDPVSDFALPPSPNTTATKPVLKHDDSRRLVTKIRQPRGGASTACTCAKTRPRCQPPRRVGAEARAEASEQDQATTIHFAHVGPLPAVECYESCVKGRNRYVKGSLLRLLTDGIGPPGWCKTARGEIFSPSPMPIALLAAHQ